MLLNKQQCLISGILVIFFTMKFVSGETTPHLNGTNRLDAYRHPLDPLSSVEMRLIGTIVRLYNSSSTWQFKFMGLREPDKAAIYPYFLSQTDPPLGLIPRRANVLIVDPVIRRPIWVIVNLSDFIVESWVESDPGTKVAVVTVEDSDLTVQIVFANPDVIRRIKALGYNGISDVVCDIWDAGYIDDNPNYSQARKLVQVYLYGTSGVGSNYYAHPLGIVIYIELGANIVRGIENLPIHQGFDTKDRSGGSVPRKDYNYFPDLLPPNSIRPGLHPLSISQPDGPSFQVNGREISWQNFQFRVGYNPREGPHIYTVTYNDNGNIRPIVYRMSLSEARLQYGDPRPPLHRKTSFDESNWEFGSSIRSLPVHQLCRGVAYYFQTEHHNEKAETWIGQNSICVVEEDAGLAWAHYDLPAAKIAASRSQRLSVSFFVSVGDADYWISWRFYEDASIEIAIKFTGILSTNLMAVDVKAPPYGPLLAPQVYAEMYQEFFCVRIDVDVDGTGNTVSVEDVVRVSETVSPSNPYGNGLTLKSTVLKTAGESATDTQPTRSWKISNPSTIQPLSGQPKGYTLVPQGDSPSLPNMLTPDSPYRSKLPWADHNMWVTPYDPDQIFVSGKYLTDGLVSWIQQNTSANIVNTDIVLWHVFSYVHHVQIEDWPVISSFTGVANFRLKPSGFFNQNPGVYSPPASATTALDESLKNPNININNGWGSS